MKRDHSTFLPDWVAGDVSPPAPPPPCMRVCTGRFIIAELVNSLRHTRRLSGSVANLVECGVRNEGHMREANLQL